MEVGLEMAFSGSFGTWSSSVVIVGQLCRGRMFKYKELFWDNLSHTSISVGTSRWNCHQNIAVALLPRPIPVLWLKALFFCNDWPFFGLLIMKQTLFFIRSELSSHLHFLLSPSNLISGKLPQKLICFSFCGVSFSFSGSAHLDGVALTYLF